MPKRILAGEWPLYGHQVAVVAAFIASPPPSPAEQRGFDRGWRYALAYEALKGQPAPLDKRGRRKRIKEIQRLSHKLVHGSKQAAAPSRAAVQRAALRYLRRRGAAEQLNISHLVAYIQSRDAAKRLYRNSGRSQPLTDHAIRAILRDRLGIVGMPGRKRRTP